MAEKGLSSALIVSHYFHLARCKLLFEEQGISAVTVPAQMSRHLVLEPYYVAREFVGYLWYVLTRPVRAFARELRFPNASGALTKSHNAELQREFKYRFGERCRIASLLTDELGRGSHRRVN